MCGRGLTGAGEIVPPQLAILLPGLLHLACLLCPGLTGELPLELAKVMQRTDCGDDPGDVGLSELKAGSAGVSASDEAPKGALNQHAGG